MSDIVQQESQEIIKPTIEYICSKVVPNGHPYYLLHVIIRKDHFNNISNRGDIITPNNYLQLAMLNLHQNQTFKAHQHKYNVFHAEQKIAQECWYIVSGQVEVQHYDLDKSKFEPNILNEGDLSITLHGGHNYTCLSENSRVLEFKTGPYSGQEQDKEFI